MCLYEEISPIKCGAVYNNSTTIKKKCKKKSTFSKQEQG